MDPNACYREMMDAMSDDSWTTDEDAAIYVREHAINLRQWLNGGGFAVRSDIADAETVAANISAAMLHTAFVADEFRNYGVLNR